jgi:uncharacterized protein
MNAYLPKLRFGWLWTTLCSLMLGFMLLALALPALAAPTFPELNDRRVVDEAGIIDPDVEADLTAKLKGLEDATTDQVVIVTLNSLDGLEIEDYGYRLGRHWGIGQSGQVAASNGQTYKDNGLIILVAPNERKVRIVVGYGLEPVMTDALSSIIIRNAMVPKFRENDYQGGIVAATDLVIEQLSLERGVAIQKAQDAQNALSQPAQEIPLWVIILAIIIFILLLRSGMLPWILLSGFGGGGGGWSGGGGGGFSGGGGGFGGGGSSGSW